MYVWQALHDHSAPPGLHPAVGGQTGQQSLRDSRELTELVQPGQAVEFVVSASSHDKVRNKGGRAPKYIARQAITAILHGGLACMYQHLCCLQASEEARQSEIGLKESVLAMLCVCIEVRGGLCSSQMLNHTSEVLCRTLTQL